MRCKNVTRSLKFSGLASTVVTNSAPPDHNAASVSENTLGSLLDVKEQVEPWHGGELAITTARHGLIALEEGPGLTPGVYDPATEARRRLLPRSAAQQASNSQKASAEDSFPLRAEGGDVNEEEQLHDGQCNR
jgi:hypothetical protein